MKKLKLSIYALLILSGLQAIAPLQAAWYDYLPQTRTQQILALASLIAASYLSQAYYRQTMPFTQTTPEPVQPSSLDDGFELIEQPLPTKQTALAKSKKEEKMRESRHLRTKPAPQKSVSTSHDLESLMQNLEQHKNHIKNLFNDKTPKATIANVKKYVNKTVIPEIKTFIENNTDKITEKEIEILKRLHTNLDWFNRNKTITPKAKSSILQDVIRQEIASFTQTS